MYKVYCDDTLIYDESLEKLQIFAPKISVELNVVSSFSFTIYPSHPYYDRLEKLKTMIRVYQNDYLLFKGRILSDVTGFYNEKVVTCESELAFLLDSIQRPYEFGGTPEDLLKKFINEHNAQVNDDKRFKVGRVTVTDPNDYIRRSDSTYLNTFETVKKKLLEMLGGYLIIRHEDDGTYIDYLADIEDVSTQKIEFSKNLLDMKRTVKADDIYTVLIPLGAKLEGSEARVDIKSVNAGKDYLEHPEGVAEYGRITRVEIWDDVTLPTNLKTKGQAVLNDAVLFLNSIELTSADLATVDKTIETFRVGTKVRVVTKPHDIDKTFIINKLAIDLLNPVNNKMSLNATFTSMTDHQQNNVSNVETVVSNIEKTTDDVSKNVADVIETTQRLETTVTNTTNMVADVYDELKSYAVDDFCIYNNILWKCKASNTGRTPAENIYWTKKVIGGELKSIWDAVKELQGKI